MAIKYDTVLVKLNSPLCEKYILEMDGGLGHGYKSTEWDLDGIERDEYKNKWALSNGIKVIRIECLKSEKEYIKNNILKSEMGKIFNLSSINWDKCHEDAISSSVKKICMEYNKGTRKIKILADMFFVSKYTVLRYLKIGKELNLINK